MLSANAIFLARVLWELLLGCCVTCRAQHPAALPQMRVITLGSTGTLATAGHGTALGVLKSAGAGHPHNTDYPPIRWP